MCRQSYCAFLLIVLCCLLGGISSEAGAVAFEVLLYGTEAEPGADGVAIYTDEGGNRRLVVEVGGITEATTLRVFVDDALVDEIAVSDGTARLERDTELAQEVPTLTEGSLVEVIAGGSEVLLLTSDAPPGCELVDLSLPFHLLGTENDPEATGEAIYVVEDCERSLVIEVEHITEADGVFFIIDGEFVEDMLVVEGAARLELNTGNDQEVPFLTEDSVIDVRRGGDEALLLTSEGVGGIHIIIDKHLFGTDNEPEAEGVAVYTVEDGERRLVVEIEHVGGSSEAANVDIYVDGQFFAFAAVEEGHVRVARDTREAQEVPEISEDSFVKVFKNDSDLLLLTSIESPAPEPPVVFEIPLFGTENDPEAEGVAVYWVSGDLAKEGGSYRKFLVEAGHITEASTVDIYVDGAFVGFVPVEDGTIRLALDTREEQEVPEVTEESVITVVRNDSEVVLLSSEEPDPDPDPEPEPEPEDDEEFVIRLFGTVNDPEAFGEGFFIHTAEFTRLLIEVSHVSSAEGIIFKIGGEFVEDLPIVEGTARLNLDTREGDEVPVFGRDAAINVFAAGTDNVILTNSHIVGDDEIASNHAGFVQVGTTIIMIAPPGSGYLWKKNGVIINDSGAKTIIIDFAIESDSGSYTCMYNNGGEKGVVETIPVSLEVLPAGALPALSLWGLIATGALAGLGGVVSTRRRKEQD